MEYTHTRRKFRVSSPINQDKQVLILIEYHWNEDDQGNVTESRSRYLTLDGWVEYSGYQVLDMSRVPQIDGIDVLTERGWELKVKDLERQFAEALNAEIDKP